MTITESRLRDLRNWLDDRANDRELPYADMTFYRDAAEAIRQLRAAEQEAWIAGIREGRQQVQAEYEPVAWMLECPTMGGSTGWILSWSQSGAGVCNRLKGKSSERMLYARKVKSSTPESPEDASHAM